MNFNRLKAYIQLSRPVNVLITSVSIPVACWIAAGTISSWFHVFLAALTGALVTAGANAVNDSFDVEIDRINRPNRPLPRGLLTQRDAQRMWFIVSVNAVGINYFINNTALLIVAFAVVLLYYYSARLKRTVLLGNLAVCFMTAMAFIYGGIVVGQIDRILIPALFAFLATFAREMVKDVEDIEGDRREHAVTFPVKYGMRPAISFATVSLLILIVATLLAVKYAVYSSSFLYIVIIADLLILISIVIMWRSSSPVQMKNVSNIIKICMVIGLLAIIIGSM